MLHSKQNFQLILNFSFKYNFLEIHASYKYKAIIVPYINRNYGIFDSYTGAKRYKT